jgi:hypothetical protein
MFNQVCVDEGDRDLVRFLWFEGGSLDSAPVEYRMTTHLFGAASSPSCANSALKMTADKFEKMHGQAASEFVRSFYVDDGLTSVPKEEAVLHLVRTSHELCEEGRFNLIKYASNSK